MDQIRVKTCESRSDSDVFEHDVHDITEIHTETYIGIVLEHKSYIPYHGLTLRINNGEYSTPLKGKRSQCSQ